MSEVSSQSVNLESSYDLVAARYAEEYFDELSRKPFDRDLLDRFADTVKNGGWVCEIGCGPGHIARYLKDRGVDIRGVDLSTGMVECASRLNPNIPFARGDMLSLEFANESLAGIVSFYAIIHLKRDDIARALTEMHRVLQPGGKLLVSFHGGEGELHRDEWYGHEVSIDVTLLTGSEMTSYLEAAGFAEVMILERHPYEFEYPTPAHN